MSGPNLFTGGGRKYSVLPDMPADHDAYMAAALLALNRRKFSSDTDIQTELRVFCEQAAEVLHAENSGIWLFSEDRSRLLGVAQYSPADRRHTDGAEVPAGNEASLFFSQLAVSRLLVLDAGDDKTFARSLLASPGIRPILSSAIWAGGEIIGAVIAELGEQRQPSALEGFFFASLADIAAAAIQAAERLRLEGHLAHAQKLEGLGIVSSALAHDLNNLVMSIVGSAGLLLTELASSEKNRTRVERIRGAAQRAGELAWQLSAVLGKESFSVANISLTDTVRELELLLRTAVSKKAELELNLAEGVPPVSGDPAQIRQLLVNLVTNASEALEQREGKISITTGARTVTADFLKQCYHGSDLPEGNYACLEVADTGTGIEENIRRQIFDPFFSTKVTGKGLGLAGVLGTVRTHGGAVHMRSSVGKGTVFCILLPLPDSRT